MTEKPLKDYRFKVRLSAVGFFDPDDERTFLGALNLTCSNQLVMPRGQEDRSTRMALLRVKMAMKAVTTVPVPYSYNNPPGGEGIIRYWMEEVPVEFEDAAIERAFLLDGDRISPNNRKDAVRNLREIILGRAMDGLGTILDDTGNLKQCDARNYWASLEMYTKGPQFSLGDARKRTITACAGGYLNSKTMIAANPGGDLRSGLEGPFYRLDTHDMAVCLAMQDYRDAMKLLTF